MIPVGWTETNLSSIATKIGDGIHATPKYTDNGDFYFINGNNINNGNLIFSENTKKVSQSEFEKYKLPLNDRTILMSINGTIGNLARYKGEAVILGKSAAYINIRDDFCENFAFHAISSNTIQNHFLSELTGSTIKNLSLKTIRNTPLLAPPFAEQQRIAEVWSTWDQAVEKVEALIANAKSQKKALMQSLLTGKVRLPGFSGKWVETGLEKLAKVTMGSSPPSSAYNDDGLGLPLIQGNADIKNRRSVPRCHTTIITQQCLPGDIIFSVRAPVGEIALSDHNACLGRGVAAIQPQLESDAKFLFYALLFAEPTWATLSQGSTFQAVNSKDLKGFIIFAPEALAERTEIGRVINEANKAEQILKAQLIALRAEKLALMQQLLTGKRRVKLDKKEAA
jgi:type I restriction enzyme, S subunit